MLLRPDVIFSFVAREIASKAGDAVRVLHVISTLDARAGGPVVALSGLAQAQAACGAHVSVLGVFGEGEDTSLADQLAAHGVTVRKIGPTSGGLRRHPDLSRVVDQFISESDVVHVHAVWEEIQHQACTAARRHGVPYIITPHGMLTTWSLGQSRLKKRLYLIWRMRRNLDRAAAIHFISRREKEATSRLRLSAPAIVEPIGVDLSEFVSLPPPGTFRRHFPQLAGRPLIVFLGRIHPGKGLEHLVPALALASEVMLAVVGPDSESFRATIERKIESIGLQDRVVFAGMLRGPDRVAALADADLFCLPSDHENFGLAVVEALAAGTPVVISKEVAIADEVEEAGVGAAVGRDAETLSRELRRWLSDADLRKSAADKSRPFVWEKFDSMKIAGNWLTRYRELAAVGGQPVKKPLSDMTGHGGLTGGSSTR